MSEAALEATEGPERVSEGEAEVDPLIERLPSLGKVRQRGQRLLGCRLVALDVADLLILANGNEVVGVGGILVPGMKGDEALGRVGDQHFRVDHSHYAVSSPFGEADAKKRILEVSRAPQVVILPDL